jgi:hypothetical protein
LNLQAGMSAESEKNPSLATEQKPRLSYSVPSNEYFTVTPPAMSTVYNSPASQTSSGGNFQEPDPARFPFIHKVLNDFLTLQRSQKSLYSIENPSTIFADIEFQRINKTLFKRMENGTVIFYDRCFKYSQFLDVAYPQLAIRNFGLLWPFREQIEGKFLKFSNDNDILRSKLQNKLLTSTRRCTAASLPQNIFRIRMTNESQRITAIM